MIAQKELSAEEIRMTMPEVAQAHLPFEEVDGYVCRSEMIIDVLMKAATKGISLDAARGFCCGEVIRYLQAQHQPAVVACTIRGKDGGTRQLCRGRKRSRTAYTFTDGTTIDMAVVATLVPGKDGKRHRKWLLFVGIDLDWSPHTVYQRYRFRFGVESTYRSLRRVRIKTSSRNPAFRFFTLGFALLLVNIWAYLRWFVARVPGPGPHRLNPVHFQLEGFVSLLRRAIELLYAARMSVPSLAYSPPS